MRGSARRRVLMLLLAVLVIAIGAGTYYVRQPSGNPNALWQIVNGKCVPHQQQLGQPAPCQQVNMAGGYAVLKDLVGPLQYLLIPVEKMSGIESERLLDPATPNFFFDAWQARHFLSEKYGAPIPDSDLSLAINAVSGRTQNQLHIHISCLRPDIRQLLNNEAGHIGAAWQPLPVKLRGHNYLARRISLADIEAVSPFIRLAHEVPSAADNMGHFSLAMAQLKGGSFILLATERDLLRFNMASSEEIQDHQCAILNPPPA